MAGGGVILLLVVGALALFRYLPALDEGRVLRTDLETMVGRVQEAGLGIDRATIDSLDADAAAARARLDRLHGLLAGDPLIALARALPLTASNVRGADSVVAAAGDLLDAVDQGLTLGRRFVDIREAQAADPKNASALSQLVELMATSRDRAVSAAASVESARQALASVPDGLIGQVESVRDAMRTRIDKYGPLLDAYVRVSARLPAILGWDGPRRYLVLTQDPAELRPSGGFIGSYGIIAFDKGRITERRFQNVSPLDCDERLPVRQAAAGAGRLPARPDAILAARGRRLVAGLPDERAGRRSGSTRTNRVTPHRRGPRDHHLHDRRAPEGHRADHRPGLRRDDRVRRDDAEGPPADPGRPGSPARTRRRFCRCSRISSSASSSRCRLGRWGDVIGATGTYRTGAPAARLVPRCDRRGVRR